MSITTGSEIRKQNEKDNLPAIQLALNGQPIYLREFRANVSVNRENEDMSGQKSTTKKAEKGVKSKTLSVTGVIPYRNADWLKTLFKLAEAEGKGGQVKYRISNITAQAVNMREGVFDGEVSAQEQDVMGWRVSFSLKEVNSVAEKTANRQTKPKTKKQVDSKAKSTGTSASGASGGNAGTSSNAGVTQDTGARSVPFNDWLKKTGIVGQ